MREAVELFIIGVSVSFSSCFVFCSPLILPYIAATRKGWKDALISVLVFLLTRLVIYSFLGFLVGLFGRLFIGNLHKYKDLIFVLVGLFISTIGLITIFAKYKQHSFCEVLSQKLVNNPIRCSILLGVAVGILPCLPVLGVFAYIGIKSKNLLEATLLGFSFGLGKFISPFIPLAVLAGSLPAYLIKNKKLYDFFRIFCGVLLFLIGLNLIFNLI